MAFNSSEGPPQSKDQYYDEILKTLKSGSEEEKKYIKEKVVDHICPLFTYSTDYESGDKTKSSYKLCCELNNYCAFYDQRWFTMFVIGVAFSSLIFPFAVIFICRYIRMYKRRRPILSNENVHVEEEVGGGAKPMKTGNTSTGKKEEITTGGCGNA